MEVRSSGTSPLASFLPEMFAICLPGPKDPPTTRATELATPTFFASGGPVWFLALEALRVLKILEVTERARTSLGPKEAALKVRGIGRLKPRRTEADRARLQCAIRWVDRLLEPGGNCLRRSLLEMGLDAGAAEESLMLGLRAGGGPRSGHAWLSSQAVQDRDYELVASV